MPANLVVVEGVQRLSHLVQNEIGYVHHVVDGAQTDGSEGVLQPFGRLFDGHACDADSRVTRRTLAIHYLYLDRQIGFLLRQFGLRLGQLYIHAMRLIVCVQVARYAVMAGSVGAVGRDIHLNHIVALHMIVLRRGNAHRRVCRQLDDAVVACADAYLVLRAQHAERLHAADLRFLDGERLVAAVEHCAQCGYDNV